MKRIVAQKPSKLAQKSVRAAITARRMLNIRRFTKGASVDARRLGAMGRSGIAAPSEEVGRSSDRTSHLPIKVHRIERLSSG